MFTPLAPCHREDYLRMAEAFYHSDAVDHLVPPSHFSAAFDALAAGSPYLSGFALTQDDEMAFALPACKIDSFVEGLVTTHKSGVARIPTPIAGLTNEPKWPPYYKPLGDYADSVD